MLAGLLVLAAAVTLRIADPWLLNTARLAAFDQLQRWAPRPHLPVPIRVIDLDDASLERLGQWPWPRDQVARMIDRLAQLGTRAIALDILFAETDRTSPSQLASRLEIGDDQSALGDALRRLPDHDLVLAEAIARAPVVTGFALAAQAGPKQPASKAGMATIGNTEFILGDRFPGAVTNLPVLEDAASGNGSLSIVADHDEVVRRVPVVQRLGDEIVPSLAVEALRVAQGASTLKARFDEHGGTLRVGRVDIPFDREGKYWVHYREDVDRQSVPAWQLFEPDAAETLQGLLSNHIVFIGTSAIGLKDLRSTPLAAFTPGVFVHAQALEQMIAGRPLTRPLWLSGVEVVAVMVAGGLLLIALTTLRARWSAVLAGLAVIAMPVVAWLAFERYGWLVDPVWPVITIIALYLTAISLTYARAERERGHIRRAFGQYMAPALVETLVEHPDRLRLGGEVRELTFLFSDIAGFTPFVERTRPEELVEILNAYLDRVCRIVLDHGGTLDKIVGDAVHAIFNAPIDQPDHAQRAVRCALAIDECAQRFVAECAGRNITFGHTRIGVNTGNAVVGNFGGDSRFDYTAHGDAINLAARLEGANKLIGTRICVAASTVAACPQVAFRRIGDFVVVGKSAAVGAFEPVGPDATETDWYRDYRAAFDLMAAEDTDARATFEALQSRFPDDTVIALHAKRLAAGEAGSLIRMSSK